MFGRLPWRNLLWHRGSAFALSSERWVFSLPLEFISFQIRSDQIRSDQIRSDQIVS